jgi:CheY-like chemotaxis protein
VEDESWFGGFAGRLSAFDRKLCAGVLARSDAPQIKFQAFRPRRRSGLKISLSTYFSNIAAGSACRGFGHDPGLLASREGLSRIAGMSINCNMSKATVLIVDDDHVSLTLLSKLVIKLDYNVIQAIDGVHALSVLKNDAVDLVIADYDMPNMNGLNLLKKVKAEFPSLPFVLVTAYSNLKVIREAWAAGAFDFFQKPVFVDRLNQTIRLATEFGHLSIARRKFPKLEELVPDPEILNIGVVRELAVALDREDLAHIVEEYETHARIELEQLLRFSMAKQYDQVKMLAHRMAGTSVNLGLVKLSEELAAIEANPKRPIKNPVKLQQNLESSIYWLNNCLGQIFEDLAG